MGTVAFLDTFSFLDTRTGMSYCGDSVEFYREMLMTFLRNGKAERLSGAFEAEDWETCQEELGALKSAALIVGAVDLSQECRSMERALREEDLETIRRGRRDILDHYHRLLEAVEKAFASRGDLAERPEASCRWGADILVVDDDPVCRKHAGEILKYHYSVDAAGSGAEALEYLGRKLPRLILLDLEMPELDGIGTMEQIREDPRLRDIPVVLMIADRAVEEEIRCFQMGATEFITKPFIKEIALARIGRILELDRLQNHLELEVDRQTRVAQDRKRKLERLTHQVIQALSGTVDAKDPYTNGHSLRVAKYAREMVRRMGMSPQEQENVYYAGMLHDIGKIGIPDGIIKKDGKLTDEEYRIIQNHPVIGAEILKNVSEIPGLTEGTRYHHERYDGSGYPDGLAGEEIPLLARVIAVADAYDAMTSYRSYRDPLPQAVVRQEIAKGRGTQFDPGVTDILLEMMDADVRYEMKQKKERAVR